MRTENQDTDLLPLIEIKLPLSDEGKSCPLFLSEISCGLFGIIEDEIEQYQSLDALFVRNRHNTFFFKASGDSMEPKIFAGDILIVDRSLKNFHGRVCVVIYNDNLICKRVLKKGEHIILRSENQKYKDILIQNMEEITLWGVVIGHASFID